MDAGRIERRCRRLGRVVVAPAVDQVTLLRSARTLKRTHDELSVMVMHRSREIGRTPEIRSAEQSLLAMDRELREVLLEYGRLGQREISGCLKEAVSKALSALDMLRASASVEAGSPQHV